MTIDLATLTAFGAIHNGQNWDVTVDTETGWIRVCDMATAYLLDGNDAPNLVAMRTYIDACAAAYDADDPERLADAYSDFCGDTTAVRAEDAPAAVVSSLTELAFVDSDDLTWGW
jgi:hypothetical protein